jgi:hypothetical protein
MRLAGIVAAPCKARLTRGRRALAGYLGDGAAGPGISGQEAPSSV